MISAENVPWKDSMRDYVQCGISWLSLDNLFTVISLHHSLHYIILLHHRGGKKRNVNLETWAENSWVLCWCWPQGEELQLVREALRSLRDNFSGHDPQHHTLDTLEQGVSSLMDRLHSLDSQRRQDRGVHNTHTHTRHLVNNESPTRVIWLFTVRDCCTPPGGI